MPTSLNCPFLCTTPVISITYRGDPATEALNCKVGGGDGGQQPMSGWTKDPDKVTRWHVACHCACTGNRLAGHAQSVCSLMALLCHSGWQALTCTIRPRHLIAPSYAQHPSGSTRVADPHHHYNTITRTNYYTCL